MSNSTRQPELGLHEVDCSTIERIGLTVHLSANGFFYCTEGSVSFMSEDRTVNLTRGHLYIYPPYSHTRITDYSDNLRGVAGIANFDFVQEVLRLTTDTRSQMLLLSNPVAKLDGDIRSDFEELLKVAMTRQHLASDKVGRLCLHALGEALCYEIIHIFFEKQRVEPEVKTRADAVFDHFIRHLNEHYRSHREVQFYAGLQCLSTRYFSSLVRRRSGRTPCEWIYTMVLNEAKRLLSDPEKSIKQVAAELSFANQSFFGSFFRQQAGCSPSAWRRGKNMT
ncbi:MAG: helix-turn-helix domain-containing protein [Muribaculaceae bacterium]|nr:helix-turn-helix domain-containing protein [Muribaculaceae bacterium]